jgi:hypothetical protein
VPHKIATSISIYNTRSQKNFLENARDGPKRSSSESKNGILEAFRKGNLGYLFF